MSETNKTNFAYTIKIKDTIQEIDSIVEKAELNLNLLVNTVIVSYDQGKVRDESYNTAYLKQINYLVKSALISSPGTDGIWFQINGELPFSPHVYSWFVFRNGKIIDLQKVYEQENSNDRKLNQEEDPYYYEAVKNRKTTWSDIYTDVDTGVSMLTISQPVYKKGVLVGVAGIDISVANLQKALKNMQDVFEQSEIFLLDQHENIILSQLAKDEINEKNHEAKYTFSELFYRKSQNKEAIAEYDDNGKQKTAIMLGLSNKYNVVITFPNELISRGFNRLFSAVYIIFGILALLVVVVVINRHSIIKINEKLEAETNKLRAVFDASPNIVTMKDAFGVYTDCNNKFLELLDIAQKEDCIGKTDYDLFDADAADEIVKNDTLVKMKKKRLVVESCYTSKSGETFCLEKYIVPLVNAKNEVTAVLVIAINVTKRNLEQQLLRHAKDAAEKATVMKSNFLANMSHEIRTPLNGVLGFIQLLGDTNLTEEQAEFVVDAKKSSEILLEIINDILDFSKIEADKLNIETVSFDIHSVVEDVAIIATSTAARKNIDINSLVCSDIPHHVFGDPGRIKQILTNLVGNAIKFTNKGGVIVYVKLVSEDEQNVIISFEVKDTGIGISEDNLKIIFESFTQADASMTRKFGGTGLGLAISQKLAGLMNGNIRVESTLGEGSTFALTLPFKKDFDTVDVANEDLNLLDGAKIVVIDDNPIDFKIIHYYLSESNCIILDAHSQAEAIEIINRENNDISLILVDYKHRSETIEQIPSFVKSNVNPDGIPLIMYSSVDKNAAFSRAKSLGFSGYLTKPIKKRELIESIISAIKREDKNISEGANKLMLNEYKFDDAAKILVVEDTELNCKFIKKVLSKEGLSCDIVNDGQQAVDAFKYNDYDLILMDCQMPILDGYDATIAIRLIEIEENREKRTPIVAMTANAMKTDRDKCFEAGMDDYITKPIKITEMLDLLAKYIKNEIKSTEMIETSSEQITGSDSSFIESIINKMVEELGFDRDESVQFFVEYIEFLPQAILELDAVSAASDYEQLKKVAHKLKGSSANLRVEKIAELSKSLEEEALKEDKEACIQIIADIKAHFEFLNSINPFKN